MKDKTIPDSFEATHIRFNPFWVRCSPLIGISIFLLIVSLIAGRVLGKVEKQMRSDVGDSLQVVLRTVQESLRFWIKHRKEEIISKASHEIVLKATKELLAVPRNQEALLAHPAQSDLRAFFRPYLDENNDLGIFVIPPDHISVASMRDVNVGVINLIAEQRPDMLARVFKGETLLVPPIRSDVPLPNSEGKMIHGYPTMFMATPLRGEDGSVIAVLTIRIDPGQNFSRVTQLGRIGNTGEMYAIDKNGIMVTESRYDDQLRRIGLIGSEERGITSIRISDPGGNMLEGFRSSRPANEWPLTRMAASASKGEAGVDVDGYRDYRGTLVLGAWLWDEELGIGIAAEIDTDEALRPYHRIRLTIVLLVCVTGLLSILLSLLLSVVSSRSRQKLQKAHDELELRVEERTASLKESETKYKTLYDTSSDAIMMLDSGKFLAANLSTIKMFGCKDEKEFARYAPADLSPEFQPDGMKSVEKAKQMVDIALEKGANFFEWKHKRINGREFYATVLLTRMELKGQTLLQATVRDVTKNKEAEEKMEEAVRMKLHFISIVSHELRAPITTIKEGVSLVLDGVLGNINAKQKDLLAAAKKNIDRLTRLVTDVLDFQKMDAGMMRFDVKKNDINKVIREAKEETEILVSGKGLKFILKCDNKLPRINFDRDKVIQVLTNLINNACKFTDEGAITIMSKQTDNSVEVCVQDTGDGIEKKDLLRLFEPFVQLDAGEKKVGGTGLGLAISKEIIHGHGGKIWAESILGKGTTFHFKLPIIERRG